MRILMLGNSFTYFNHLPDMLAELLDARVVSFTKGGITLSTFLDPESDLGVKAMHALKNEKWDYVVLQEYSTGPITDHEGFMRSVEQLTSIIHAVGSTPVLYATWAFKKGGVKLATEGLDYDSMYQELYDAYHQAGETYHALIADVGEQFYTHAAIEDLYASDDYHPSHAGSRLAAETIAGVISKKKAVNKNILPAPDDNRLRILFLYRLLQQYTDETRSISRPEIMQQMDENGFHIHRTALPRDIEVLRAAGIEIAEEKNGAIRYRLVDRTFSLPELRLLIDAVLSSKFITQGKSKTLAEKLTTLTSKANAETLQRAVYVAGRVKSENEKGYYIVDAINDAMNRNVKISFPYFDYNATKAHVWKNGGAPYTVSPYDLIWDGDFYYMVGFCDDRGEVRTFRVDRIEQTPEILEEEAVKRPRGYHVERYTQESFRMFATQETVTVKLICREYIMKSIIDRFGTGARTKNLGDGTFRATVKVCASPNFYRWIFASNGAIIIEGPDEVREEYGRILLDEIKRYELTEQ